MRYAICSMTLALAMLVGCERDGKETSPAEGASAATERLSRSVTDPQAEPAARPDACADLPERADPPLSLVLELDDEGVPRAVLCARSPYEVQVPIDPRSEPFDVKLRTKGGKIIEETPTVQRRKVPRPLPETFHRLEKGEGVVLEAPVLRRTDEGYELRWYGSLFEHLGRGEYELRATFRNDFAVDAAGTKVPGVYQGEVTSNTLPFSVPPSAPELAFDEETLDRIAGKLEDESLVEKLEATCDEARRKAMACIESGEGDACVIKALKKCDG